MGLHRKCGNKMIMKIVKLRNAFWQFEEEEYDETLEFRFPATVHAEPDGDLSDDAASSVSFGKLLAEYEVSCRRLDLPARLFLWDRRRCRDSLEIRAERSAASETHRDGAGRKKEEKAGVFQPTYLERV